MAHARTAGTALATSLLVAALASAAGAAQIGRDADLLRTGWYPDQPGLSPQAVSSDSFGQRFSTPVTGQVYAQPLVHAGTLFVATEQNWIYGLDPVSGAVKWSRNVDVPWNASDLGCTDLAPYVGITATPVIDAGTGIAYFTSKTYAHGTSGAAVWKMHAVAVGTGAEQSGFPVTLQGKADNNTQQTFPPTTENQRPGLLLMNGVVYAAFSSVCDDSPFQGWVIGVSTGGSISCRWVDRSGNGTSGGGIWMSGSGLVSDAPGQILLVSGNGGTPVIPSPGNTPPADLGESIVRLTVQSNGTLMATDFFTPFDAFSLLDPVDGDLGSGGVVGLPPAYFGTPAYPSLFVQSGKEGVVYLLDGTWLGGYQWRDDGGDSVVQETGRFGSVYARPAVWGGDGGWIYFPATSTQFPPDEIFGYLRAYTMVDSGGKPALVLMGTAADSMGFGTSSPVVTSNGANSGSALLWIVRNHDATGVGAELCAYDPVPVSGVLHLRWRAPVGRASKFNPPGVAGNSLYVGTRDGNVVCFGFPPGSLTAVHDSALESALGPASPNPFVRGTSVQLSLAQGGHVSLVVYDLGGRRVRRLVDGEVAAGRRTIVWDGRDESGANVPPGLYLIRLDSAQVHETRRAVSVR